jgi:transcriptional regulator with XRE-family HTH domain
MTKINAKFNSKQLAKDILSKREKDNLTYAQAEKETGLYKSVIHRAESGLNVSLDALPVLCNWLGVQVQKYFILVLVCSLAFVSCKKEEPVRTKPVSNYDLSRSAKANSNPIKGTFADIVVTFPGDTSEEIISLVDVNTGIEYAARSQDGLSQIITVPKKGTFAPRLFGLNNTKLPYDYLLYFNSEFRIGMTLQPGLSMYVGGVGNEVSLTGNDSLTLKSHIDVN